MISVESAKEKEKRWRWLGLSLLMMAMLGLTSPAFAQSCALCYTQAASSGSKMIQALRSGILILIVPPTLGTIGLIFVVHHKRNQVRRSEEDQTGEDW
jgi:ABC-type Fe3+ transport system permease subunit